jgi:hypothetical protein
MHIDEIRLEKLTVGSYAFVQVLCCEGKPEAVAAQVVKLSSQIWRDPSELRTLSTYKDKVGNTSSDAVVEALADLGYPGVTAVAALARAEHVYAQVTLRREINKFKALERLHLSAAQGQSAQTKAAWEEAIAANSKGFEVPTWRQVGSYNDYITPLTLALGVTKRDLRFVPFNWSRHQPLLENRELRLCLFAGHYSYLV